MTEYNQRIDEQISDILRREGLVAPDGLPGLSEEDGERLLRHYVQAHSAEVPLLLDERGLTWAPAANAAAPIAEGGAPPVVALSPVDQVLAAPSGKALLDSAAAGPPVNRALWLLPLSLGLVGGLLAWIVVRESNPRVAKSLLLTGAAIQLVSVCVGVAFGSALGPTFERLVPGARSSGGSAVWTASETGRPTFHYFGTAT